jgi:hypothetical protein
MPRISQFVPQGATPNTPNHYPVTDQPNTPSMESNAMAVAEKAGTNQDPSHATPALLRTEEEINAGREAVQRHTQALESARNAQREADEKQTGERAERHSETLESGEPLVRDAHADMTPVTLEDGSQARVPSEVADAARSADRARSADIGTGKFPRGVDPRNPKVRKEEAHPDLDRNTPRGPASLGIDEGESGQRSGVEENPDNARLP